MLKLLAVAVYTNFETSIVHAESMEQKEGVIGGPVGEKLILQLHPILSRG